MTVLVSHKHRQVGVPVTAQLKNLFPVAPVITHAGNELILLKHEIVETKLLRNMGHEVPAPVLTGYDWAGGTPFEVQKKTVGLLTMEPRAYVLNGMGTGKTKSALWAYDYLRGKGLCHRALIIAPLSTLNFTWAKEIFATIPHRTFSVVHSPNRERRLKRLDQESDIYITNPDGLSTIWERLRTRHDIDCIIIDELAMFRNASSNRGKLAARLVNQPHIKWAWGMTGSPTPNEPTDAFGQCKIITPGTVPKYFGKFRDQVMTKVTQFKYVPKPEANETVFQVMQPAVRFTLDDVVELPEVIERTIDLDLGAKQGKVYEELRKHAFALAEQGAITAVNAGAVLNKLLQVSLGYVYGSPDEAGVRPVIELDNDLRLDALTDAILSTDHKVLVFVPFTHALDGIARKLRHEGIDHALVHGGVSKRARDDIFAAFQGSSKYKVIAAHPNTMSHGLTLTAASTVIWFGPTTSLEVFEQANARVRRIGQRHKQQILMFQSTAAERKIYTRLRQKQSVQNDLLDMFASQDV
jgi:SNF2 family DNA or RNA helicase